MRITKTLLFTLATLFAITAVAAEGKIAVVDFSKALFGTDVAKARLKQVESESDYTAMQAKY